MATMERKLLSGSTNGRGIKVVQTATAGTTIHTAVAGTSDADEIWIYAVNTQAGAVKLTLEWGDASVDDNIEVTIDGESGLTLVAPGLMLRNGLVVKAFAGTGNVVILHGYVNRITA
mgnify:FL=1